MTSLPSTDKAWRELVEFARQPNTTIETVQENSENEIGVDSQQNLFFRKKNRGKRTISRDEFNKIWRSFEETGELTRKEVGEITSERVGSALFGAIYTIFDFDSSTSPLSLHYSEN